MQAAGDARADAHLGLAMADLQRLTGKMRDPAQRQHLLTALQVHGEITAAWAALQSDARA